MPAVFLQAVSAWKEHNVPRLAAALAYYTLVSLAPLLIIVVAVAGWAFGREAAQGKICAQVAALVGEQGGRAIESIIQNADQPATGVIATLIGVLILLFGAGGVFVELHDSLNLIWRVPTKPGRGIFRVLRERFLSFAMVLGVCFLLLVSLVISAALSALGTFLGEVLPKVMVLQAANFILSFGIITLLFSMMFKYLPDAPVLWKDVWLGAVLTALLFTIGKYLIGLYLGRSSTTSVFGAAGSLVTLLIWVYYSAQIFFFGAEFTSIVAHKRRSPHAEEKRIARHPAKVTQS